MNVIKALREEASLTQEQLAEKLGVDRSAVAKWDTGIAFPKTDRLPTIAKILNCTVDDLLNAVQENGARATAQEKAAP